MCDGWHQKTQKDIKTIALKGAMYEQSYCHDRHLINVPSVIDLKLWWQEEKNERQMKEKWGDFHSKPNKPANEMNGDKKN